MICTPPSNNRYEDMIRMDHNELQCGWHFQLKTKKKTRFMQIWKDLRNFHQNKKKTCSTCLKPPRFHLQQLPLSSSKLILIFQTKNNTDFRASLAICYWSSYWNGRYFRQSAPQKGGNVEKNLGKWDLIGWRWWRKHRGKYMRYMLWLSWSK